MKHDTHPLQCELDLLDTVAACTPVIEAWTMGYHNDLEAIRRCGIAIQHKAHRAQVARVNRKMAAGVLSLPSGLSKGRLS